MGTHTTQNLIEQRLLEIDLKTILEKLKIALEEESKND